MYLYFKALHIVFVISWFAGLFYLPRLFIYHTDAQTQPEPARGILSAEFSRIAKLLFNIIMVPAMWLTIGTAVGMLWLVPSWIDQGWMQLKLLFVVGLIAYHFHCRTLLLELRAGIFRWSSLKLRLWNEVATVLLFGVVFLVVLKNTFDFLYGLLGFFVFAGLLMSAVKLAKTIREKK